MKKIRFSINLSADKMMRYYAGQASVVMVRSDDGQTIQLPASSFRDHVTDSGVQGRFEISLDANNRLIEMRRIE